MSVSITKKPILPVITIYGSSTKTYNPHIGTFDFRLQEGLVTPPFENKSGRFDITIVSDDASNTNANTLLNTITGGTEILFSLGKTSSTTDIMRGVIEKITILEPTNNLMRIKLSGPDFGSDIIDNRIVKGEWIQDRDTDGNLVSDTKVEVSQIVTDILTKAKHYPASTIDYSDPTIEDQGITVSASNINPQYDVQLAQFLANFEKGGDVLEKLDRLSGSIHYVTPAKDFIMKKPPTLDNTATITAILTDSVTDSVAVAHSTQSEIGLIEPNSTYTVTWEDHIRRLIGLGGSYSEQDQKQQTDTTSTECYTQYLAQKFTPVKEFLDHIRITITKTGSPSNLLGFVIEDNGGEPTGTNIGTFTIDKLAISTATQVAAKIGSRLNTAKSYWIVLVKQGDSSNYYKWHRDNTSSYINAYSTDGTSWTVQSSSYGFMFETHVSENYVFFIPPTLDASSKHFHESVIKDNALTDLNVLYRPLIVESGLRFQRKEIFSGFIYAPDVLLQNGDKVRIRKQASGYKIDDAFLVSGIDYIFESDPINQMGMMHYNISATKFGSF